MPTNDANGTLIERPCNIEAIDNATLQYDGGQCKFAEDHCDPESPQPINFYTLYYCSFDDTFGGTGRVIVFIPFGVFMVFIAMYLLATTADDYLSPSLETIVTRFSV